MPAALIQQNEEHQTRLSLATTNWRTKMAVAFALMTVIPVLTFAYFIVIHMAPHMITRENILIAVALNLVLSLAGFSIVIDILISLSRFRQHLDCIAQGELPQALSSIRKGPEVDSITRSVDMIVESIQHDRERLRVFSEELEKKVEERTAELKQVNEALRDSRERFSKSFHASPIPILIARVASGRIIDANEKFLDMIGLAGENIIGRILFELHIGATADEEGRLMQILQEQHRVNSMEFKLRTRSGVTRDTLVSMESIKISGNACTLAMFIDITERKRSEEQVLYAERLAGVAELAAGIAREIKNPLDNIESSTRLCLSTQESTEDMKKHLSVILRNLENARRIIQDLLHFASHSPVSPEWVNIAEILDKAHDVVREKSSRQQVEIIKKISQGLPRIASDGKRLEVAFVNIITNALDAMSDGGKLVIAASVDSRVDEIELHFTDTGTGIPAENMDKVFVPFFTTREQGVGLGLSLAQHIVNAHKGTIVIRSEAGKGTDVAVRLPIST